MVMGTQSQWILFFIGLGLAFMLLAIFLDDH